MTRKKTAVTNSQPVKSVLPEGDQEAPEMQAELIPEETEETPDTKAEEQTAPEEETKKPEKPEAVAYMGPDIERCVNHGTIYEGGEIPEYLKEKIKEIPAIKGLIVPVSMFAQVAKDITLPKGRYRMLYDMVLGAVKLR